MELLREAPLIDACLSDNGSVELSGVVTLARGNSDLDQFASTFAEAIAAHRHFGRNVAAVPA